MDKGEAIEKVQKFKMLVSQYFILDEVYLYGSYAKDSYHIDSDIDVALVMNSIPEDFFSVNPLLWRLRRSVDDRIEPIVLDKHDDRSGFLEEIKRSGIAIH